ncbi:hypothetical protein OE418_09955 [Pseudomonas aeruginosa]|nr:hypothetical protein [Pseudomonas aeruginosa]
MRKSNHRAAFASDPKFVERIARQLQSEPTSTLPSPADIKPSKAVQRLEKVQTANMDGRKDRISLESTSRVLTICFPGAKLVSLNTMLRVHDAKATRLKNTWLKRVEALRYTYKAVLEEWIAIATYPLLVEEVYITGESSLLDPESVTAACKPVIDALVSNGFLPDDDPSHIAHPLPYTSRGESPGLVICLRPAGRPWGLIEDATIQVASSLGR